MFLGMYIVTIFYHHFFKKLRFTPWKAEEPIRDMELQEKEEKKIKSKQEKLFRRNLTIKSVY